MNGYAVLALVTIAVGALGGLYAKGRVDEGHACKAAQDKAAAQGQAIANQAAVDYEHELENLDATVDQAQRDYLGLMAAGATDCSLSDARLRNLANAGNAYPPEPVPALPKPPKADSRPYYPTDIEARPDVPGVRGPSP